MELFVDDAGRGGHPLHVAGTDLAAAAGGITVLQFALVDDGHGFETAMRVLADATTLGGGREFSRGGVVQQQERADVLAQVVIGKQRANLEAIADPMGPRTGVEADDVFHAVSPKIRRCDSMDTA